jgi:hypothetical protein
LNGTKLERGGVSGRAAAGYGERVDALAELLDRRGFERADEPDWRNGFRIERIELGSESLN